MMGKKFCPLAILLIMAAILVFEAVFNKQVKTRIYVRTVCEIPMCFFRFGENLKINKKMFKSVLMRYTGEFSTKKK